MTLTEAAARVGARVTYSKPSRYPDRPEHGVITQVNATFVFVRYDAGSASLATLPEHLEFEVDL